MASTVIDYTTSYSELPLIDKIHGESSYKSLNNPQKQVNTNDQLISSDMGGG